MTAHPQFAALGGGFKIQSARKFVTDRQVVYVNRSVDHRCIQRARPLQRKVRAALYGQGIQMNLPNPR